MEQPETAPLYTETAPDGRRLPFWEVDTLACEQYTGYTLLVTGTAGEKVYVMAMSKDQQQLLRLSEQFVSWSLIGISDRVYVPIR